MKENIAMKLQPEKQRIRWIDCAKTVAIIAVLVDHNSGLLYQNNNIKIISYFSVSLFILLAGITAFDTTKVVRGGGRHKYWQGLSRILLHYAIATFILQVWYTHFFDLQTYISHLLHFSIQAPFYFLLFFLQLKLISPFLVMWCQFCNKQSLSWLWHIASVLFLCWFSSVLIRYTFMLPVGGGGNFLFGGTYLLLYYIGILLSAFGVFGVLRKRFVLILFISISFSIIWCWLYIQNIVNFDALLADYYGIGKNPPSVRLLVLSITVLFICYSVFGLLEDSAVKINQEIVDAMAFIGRYTLYIFMYHLMVRDVILTFLPVVQTNIWLMRFAIFIPMLVAPALVVWLINKIKNRFMQIALEADLGGYKHDY